jgi:hypothetical protein
MDVDYCTATDGAGVWYMGSVAHGSVDGGNNTNVEFDDPALTTQTDAETGLTMDRDGVTGGTFNGQVTNDIDGTPVITTYTEYGLTGAYGAQTGNVAVYDDGAFTGTVPASLTPGSTYHFRAVATNNNAGSPFNGADDTLTFTMPTVTTGTALLAGSTVTLNGDITALGEATDTYVRIEYGTTAGYGNATDWQIINAISAFEDDIKTPVTETTLYYRAVTKVGTIIAYGIGTSIPITSAAGGWMLKIIAPILIVVLILVRTMWFSNSTNDRVVGVIIGITILLIVNAILAAI